MQNMCGEVLPLMPRCRLAPPAATVCLSSTKQLASQSPCLPCPVPSRSCEDTTRWGLFSRSCFLDDNFLNHWEPARQKGSTVWYRTRQESSPMCMCGDSRDVLSLSVLARLKEKPGRLSFRKRCSWWDAPLPPGSHCELCTIKPRRWKSQAAGGDASQRCCTA